MSYFLPSFFQKRVLRYALSRLQVVDTDALDLDSLGITWGQRSTFELRDVGLRLEKLSSSIQLPPTCEFTKARVSLLRVTIPADIYSSSIIVEAEGIQINLRLLPDEKLSGRGQRKGSQTDTHDPGSEQAQTILPSTTDLAQNFLDSEPREETEELQAALSSQSQYPHQPDVFSDEEDEDVGLQEGVSLPSFVAGFFKSVLDRLELKISDVSLRIDMEVQPDAPSSSKQSAVERVDPISAMLTIRDISIDSVATETAGDTRMKVGKRLTTLSEIHVMLLSDQSVFENYSRFHQHSSPSVSHSRTSPTMGRDGLSPQAPPSATSSFHTMTRSTIFERPTSTNEEHSQNLEASTFSHGRFSDAATEDEYDVENDRYESRSIAGSQGEDFFLDNPTYLEEAMQYADDIEDSTGDLNPSFSGRLAGYPSDARREVSHRSLGPNPAEHFIRPTLETDHPSIHPSSVAEDRMKRQEDIEDDQPPADLYCGSTDALEQEGDLAPGMDNTDDLSESRLFTHEEAQSMYMSVMSHAPSDTASLPRMPGAFGSPESDSTLMERSREQPSRPRPETTRDSNSPTPRGSTIIGQEFSGAREEEGPADANQVRCQTEPPQSLDHISGIAKKVVDVEKITLWIPPLEDRSPEDVSPEVCKKPPQHMKESTFSLAESDAHDVPESSKPRSSHDTHRHETAASSPPSDRQVPSTSRRTEDSFNGLTEDEKSRAVEVDITSGAVRFDIACGWLSVKMCQKLVTAWAQKAPEEEEKPQTPALALLPITLSLSTCRVQFLEHLSGRARGYSTIYSPHHSQGNSSHEDLILHVTLSDTTFSSTTVGRAVKSRLDISKFVFGHAAGNFISFDDSLRLRESTRDVLAPVHGDISLSFTNSPTFSQVHLSTLPLHLSLNLRELDETLSWFGGLSTVLELGSSVVSASTSKGPKQEAKPKPKGVHFEQPPVRQADSSPKNAVLPWKVNCRIGGLAVHLIGKKCSVKLETSAVKIVSRFAGMGIQIDKGRLSGPHHTLDDSDNVPHTDVLNIRLEYLSEPKEVDLDRLLNLLTPSKNKYDEDDDIMLDTLFRQRREGGVLRVNVSNMTTVVPHPELLLQLSSLGNELAKLSTVAKYIPQDDRPGIMTLVLVREFEGQIHLGKDVGTISVISHGVEGCHISFPSLLAARVSTITVVRNGSEELVGEAVSQETPRVTTQGSLPMIMARYIADEMEPAIKLKLFNLRVEYTVPSVTALLGLSSEMTGEDIAANMAHSVVNLADLKARHAAAESSEDLEESSVTSEVHGEPSTPPRLSIALRDCLVGLNPRQSPAKGLVVLSHAQFSGILHEEEPSEAILDVQKASLVIIDDVANIGVENNLRSRKSTSSQSGQVRTLEGLGYVPVGTVSSARAVIKIMQLEAEGDKSLDVELKDDLLIVETCADSTQTLITILNGLAPPTPPEKMLKYRTEVIPIEDMLGSFSGNAFEMQQAAGSDSPSAGGGGLSPVAENPADELEYVSDFYPSSGSTGTGDDAVGGGFENLLESFHSEAQVSSGVLGLDFREDHFAKKSAVGGTAHRWDSTHNTYSLANEVKLHGSPLRIRVRDVHVIWNLFDGYDWQKTRDAISKTVKDVQTKAMEKRSHASPVEEEEEESVIGDFLFNSVYIGIPTNRDPRELSHEINRNIDDLTSETGSHATSTTATGFSSHAPGRKREKLRLARSKHHKMTFELKGLAADMVVFPPNSGETQSSLDIRVHDLEIFDHLPTSTWKKFATYMNDAGERELGTSMVHLEVLNVKPVAELAASELILKANILPLRLHVDQDALDFMSRFFEFKDDSAPVHPTPGDIPFLQRVEINAIQVRLDFKPKRVDYGGLRSGRTTEFMNFFVLDEADMVLRHVIIYGVSGFERLGQTVNDIWMPDIKANQLPGILAGLAPVRSLVNIGGGVKDLVVIPMREYRKDGRVVRSIQKGALSFAKTTTNELVKLGAKLAIGTQTALQNAEGLLNYPSGVVPQPVVPAEERLEDTSIDEDEEKQISLYADQPVGVVHGLRGAYSSLERDLLLARDAIVAVPGEVIDSGSATGAAKALWKRAPTVVLRPAIGASKAVGQTLLGAGNTLDPKNRRRVDDKYKRH